MTYVMARSKKKRVKTKVIRVRLDEYDYNKAQARANIYNDGNLSGFARNCITGGSPKLKKKA